MSTRQPTVYTHEGGVMVTKRVSPGKKTTRQKATAAAELTDGAAMVVLESAASTMGASTSVDPSVRRQLVAAEAYFRAERRGFAAGNELDDWGAAEAALGMRLQPTHPAEGAPGPIRRARYGGPVRPRPQSPRRVRSHGLL